MRQGDGSKASENRELGQLVIRGIPEAPARAERIFVTFKVDTNNVLTVIGETSNGIKEEA